MSETITPARSSPFTGTVLPRGRPFWIVDGRAYDFTEWMKLHPGGAMWFRQTEGRDISALLHTYHREPARLRKFLARYEIEELVGKTVQPRILVPPRASDPPPPPPPGSPPFGGPPPPGGPPPAAPPHAGPPPIGEGDLLPKLGIPPFLL